MLKVSGVKALSSKVQCRGDEERSRTEVASRNGTYRAVELTIPFVFVFDKQRLVAVMYRSRLAHDSRCRVSPCSLSLVVDQHRKLIVARSRTDTFTLDSFEEKTLSLSCSSQCSPWPSSLSNSSSGVSPCRSLSHVKGIG